MVLKPKQEPPQVNAILASVNGVPISLMDILNTTRNSEYQAYAVFSGKRLEEEIRKIRLKAVNDRIDKLLVLEEFRENPFPIPNQAVEEELDNIAERMGVRSRSEFTRRLRQSGTTIEDLRKEVEEYIILQMMIFDRIRVESNITPREVIRDFIELLNIVYQNPGIDVAGLLNSEQFEFARTEIDGEAPDQEFEEFEI